MEKTKKRRIVIAGTVLVFMIISAFGLVAAWSPCGSFGTDVERGFHGRPFHHGFHHGDLMEFVLWRMDRGARNLDLSGAQQEKYDQIRAAIETHMTEGMGEKKRMMETFHREILQGDPDIRFITGSLKERLKEMTGSMEETLDLFAEFYESLDDGQRDKVLGPVRERIKGHEKP